MKYGQIPGIRQPVSRVAQGVIMLRQDEPEAGFALLDAALEAGINLFDSAHVYGGGQADRVFGQWVASRGVRDKVVLMDKCCHHNADRKRVTPFDISADLHDCLARLGFETIDIFSFHRDDPTQPVGPLVERMNQHIAEGRIRAYGASNWSHQRIAEANEYAAAHNLTGMAVSSPQYSLADCVEDPWGGGSISLTGPDNADARDWYARTGLAVLPWSSLAGGFFSGRFTRDNLDSFTDGADQRCVRCYCTETNFQRLDRARELADRKNASLAQIALAWTIQGPLNCFPLMAGWTPEQVRENAAAANIELSAEEVDWLANG